MTDVPSQQGVTRVVIVGAGQAGSEAAVALRQAGHEGPITLLGNEPHPPYRRPPLSKDYLAGKSRHEDLYVKPVEAYAKLLIDFHPRRQVVELDRASKRVSLDDGESLSYDKLILATGGRPRRLELAGSDAPNVHYIRTIDDIDGLRAAFLPGTRMVIIGAGYIGLETAAVAIQHGLDVTVLETAERVLARVAAVELSTFYESIHTTRGVKLHTSTTVLGLELDRDHRVRQVLTNKGPIEVDVLVVGIGLIPNTELAVAAGLDVDGAITTDEFTRTSDPDILAIGDCTSHPNAFYGKRLRLESVQNALEQARTAAATIMGQVKPYNPVPWFWSDQYELKLQMVGLSQGHDRTVIRGAMADNSFAVFYLHGSHIIAVDAVNRPQDFLLAKRLVAARIKCEPGQLADVAFPLKSLFESAVSQTQE
ncbi:NAD(P)/FAD-dependent oxidoreductase [Pseudomonas brassicacearum]|jgi:3-phenylpropionate/trans-cinnamate dioxygenase ferredoxin reductase subunit|uniref:Pyridine nucleotide-disulfide oxidoreductase n=1 Tax=Pseudomonas brassicacearum TaxID=930166 RepID=A0A423JJW0_9PSED|nr:FAD-dependent oxidoreductase [Pseudomonas brassicacearum]RON37919.1 pyridine nucleotide-disulfide oxidoreductase [Pseudomonas brassicacearum]